MQGAKFQSTISLEALTDDFYPTILVSKNILTSDIGGPVNAASGLTFPNFSAFNYTFGDNFTQVANQNNVSP